MMNKQLHTTASVLARNSQVEANAKVARSQTEVTATLEVVAASSALWKFAWAANNATENPMDRQEFKEKQQTLSKYLTDNYKPRIIKTVERKMSALGGKAKALATAIVTDDSRKMIQLLSTVKLSWEHAGVLAAIAAFYKQQGE